MSHFQTHGRPSTGFLVLQHQGYDKQGRDLIQRAGQHCIRVMDRMDQDDGLGHFVEDPDSRSDLLGGNFWQADYSQRVISGAAFAWPAVISSSSGPPGVPTVDPSQSPGGGNNPTPSPGNPSSPAIT